MNADRLEHRLEPAGMACQEPGDRSAWRDRRVETLFSLSTPYRGGGVRLPEDYRQFLIEVGSGAGPYNGLFSPTGLLEEMDNWLEVRRPNPSLPFGITRVDAP
jgi:hypothetical protein